MNDLSEEDLDDIRLAEEALARVRSGDERTYTLAEVSVELGLDAQQL